MTLAVALDGKIAAASELYSKSRPYDSARLKILRISGVGKGNALAYPGLFSGEPFMHS